LISNLVGVQVESIAYELNAQLRHPGAGSQIGFVFTRENRAGGRIPRLILYFFAICRQSAALLAALVLSLAGCKSQSVSVHPQDNEAPPLASSIRMSDARIEPQLVSGFYGVEQGAWRWTARQFSVVLRPPVGSAKKGATIELRLTVPPVVIEKSNTITLSATAGGKPLPPETYTQAGDYVYSRDIPSNLLADEVLRVDFSLDKSMPPSGQDLRELGVIVLSVGLNPK
jgi:hypothetical protein